MAVIYKKTCMTEEYNSFEKTWGLNLTWHHGNHGGILPIKQQQQQLQTAVSGTTLWKGEGPRRESQEDCSAVEKELNILGCYLLCMYLAYFPLKVCGRRTRSNKVCQNCIERKGWPQYQSELEEEVDAAVTWRVCFKGEIN